MADFLERVLGCIVANSIQTVASFRILEERRFFLYDQLYVCVGMCAAKIIQTVASFRILKKKHLFLNFQLYMCVGEG